jgi:GMP synthase-like glutamine amidotransferase
MPLQWGINPKSKPVKPVAIFRFSVEDGPGYFASFLDMHAVPWILFKLDEGESVPELATDYAGLVFMGGPMSANDSLPWIAPIVRLIRRAVEDDLPCLGHCLGGQLMSKALGGAVVGNRVKEIGWNRVTADDSAVARAWLGEDAKSLTTFQWHGETFSIPEGAERILTSDACPNQAFVIGKSLGMQCHTEMTPEMVEDWCQDWAAENVDPALPSIQTPEEMLSTTRDNILALRLLADQLYGKWLAGVYPHLPVGAINRENY